MVWPVNMEFTKQFNSDEVQLTVNDWGNCDANGECSERVILRRFYKNADDAFAALTIANNQLSKAMWDCYSSEYEISCIGITIDGTSFGSIDNYEDENGNLVLTEYFETGTTLDDFREAFKFKQLDKLNVRTYNEHTYSKDAIANEANKQMQGYWLEDADDLFSEFSAYITYNESAINKELPEIIAALKDCGALDKAYGITE